MKQLYICETPSRCFTGLCFSRNNCGAICEKEGFSFGVCKALKCVCAKDCNAGGGGGGNPGQGPPDEGPPEQDPPGGGGEEPPVGQVLVHYSSSPLNLSEANKSDLQ